VTFVPYHLLDGRPSLIVDGSPAPGTVLNAKIWRGVPFRLAAAHGAIEGAPTTLVLSGIPWRTTWRDRPGAALRFAEQVRATVRQGWLEPHMVLVFEGQAREGAAESDADGVEVVHAPGEGDDAIVSVAESPPQRGRGHRSPKARRTPSSDRRRRSRTSLVPRPARGLIRTGRGQKSPTLPTPEVTGNWRYTQDGVKERPPRLR